MGEPLTELVEVEVGGERVDAVALAAEVLAMRGIVCERQEHGLVWPAVGLVLSPRVVGVQAAERARLRTVSIVRVQHATAFPTPLFEYQHGLGDGLRAALMLGFDGFAQLDAPVLADATRAEPLDCAMIRFQHPARSRRVLLGPPAWMGAARNAEVGVEGGAADDAHTFCPCCLFTRSIDAFKPLVESDETFGLRLYAGRDPAGACSADCRVNGVDFPAGKAALEAYARTWPPMGVESRKQYVVVQNEP
ncbi:MAG TPA: DUF6348 family protein [Polyangia bacterium]